MFLKRQFWNLILRLIAHRKCIYLSHRKVKGRTGAWIESEIRDIYYARAEILLDSFEMFESLIFQSDCAFSTSGFYGKCGSWTSRVYLQHVEHRHHRRILLCGGNAILLQL